MQHKIELNVAPADHSTLLSATELICKQTFREEANHIPWQYPEDPPAK